MTTATPSRPAAGSLCRELARATDALVRRLASVARRFDEQAARLGEAAEELGSAAERYAAAVADAQRQAEELAALARDDADDLARALDADLAPQPAPAERCEASQPDAPPMTAGEMARAFDRMVAAAAPPEDGEDEDLEAPDVDPPTDAAPEGGAEAITPGEWPEAPLPAPAAAAENGSTPHRRAKRRR